MARVRLARVRLGHVRRGRCCHFYRGLARGPTPLVAVRPEARRRAGGHPRRLGSSSRPGPLLLLCPRGNDRHAVPDGPVSGVRRSVAVRRDGHLGCRSQASAREGGVGADRHRRRSAILSCRARLHSLGAGCMGCPFPVDRKTVMERVTAIEERAAETPVVPNHFQCKVVRGRPMHTQFDGWKDDCSFSSGMVWEMPHHPCVTFTFLPEADAWQPPDLESLAAFPRERRLRPARGLRSAGRRRRHAPGDHVRSASPGVPPRRDAPLRRVHARRETQADRPAQAGRDRCGSVVPLRVRTAPSLPSGKFVGKRIAVILSEAKDPTRQQGPVSGRWVEDD